MKKIHPIVWAILCLPVVYFAMVTASVYIPGENVFALLERFSTMVRRLDLLRWTAYTPRFLLVFLLLYGGGVLLYYADHENRRPGEEYGSAKWGNARELNKRYADQNGKNVILTKHVSIGLDGYRHRRNLNILVVGGSGSGKTRFFCKPGIMSVNCSYLIVDPKGEMLRSTGYLLKEEGYDIKVFDLVHPRQSDGYNPFTYIRDDPDVLKLMDNLVKNTTPPKGASNDPFWEKAEIALDSALMLYLVSEAPPEEQNFEMLIYMMNFAEVREEDDQYGSPLDMLFRALEEEQPNHVAVKQYKAFKQAAGKTAKSILVSAAVRLAPFNLPQIKAIANWIDTHCAEGELSYMIPHDMLYCPDHFKNCQLPATPINDKLAFGFSVPGTHNFPMQFFEAKYILTADPFPQTFVGSGELSHKLNEKFLAVRDEYFTQEATFDMGNGTTFTIWRRTASPTRAEVEYYLSAFTEEDAKYPEMFSEIAESWLAARGL